LKGSRREKGDSRMKVRTLRARFLLAGCLLVSSTVAVGAWSAFTFAHLGAVIDSTLRESQEAIDLTATLASVLEREDDALLLVLTGDAATARQERQLQEQQFDEAFGRLEAAQLDSQEQEAARDLRDHVAAYRQAGAALLETNGAPQAGRIYHERVNPALRLAVADCGRIRERNYDRVKQAGIDARNEARRATWMVGAIALVSLFLSIVVAVRLAGAILRPVRDLIRSVGAIRRADFSLRVAVNGVAELRLLAEEFNRMAEMLADYRASSLGELLLAKATLEAALAALPDAVIVVDPDGAIVTRNPMATEVLRALGGEGAGRIQELAVGPTVLQSVEETLRGGRVFDGRRDLGQALSLSLRGRPLKMLPRVAPIPEFLPRRCGAVLVLDDVTEFARLDELRGELVAVASHELKTPLTSLQMNLLLLAERADNLTPRQREILEAAVHGGEDLRATIEELLDLTRIEAGQLRLVRERVDPGPVAEQVVRALRPRFEDAEVNLRILKESPLTVVRGDAARLRIVFANLLGNALKYTPRGGEVTLRLATVPATTGGKVVVRICVADTGPGVPAEFRERIFEKFFRVEDHRVGEPQGVRGAGIGLYLCRQIIEAHGGTIRAEAGEGGRGTLVVTELEAEPAEGPA
jgi:NtrC-family two-component system sensor histidine kinase KinB